MPTLKTALLTLTFVLSLSLATAPLGCAEPAKLDPGPATVAAAPVVLAPKAVIRLEFPELSDNMATMFGDKKIPNVLQAELPANYSADKQFPIVVFLEGGTGGGDMSTKRLRDAVGENDYICVRMPLFKKEKITTDPVGGLFILTKDVLTISQNYRVMLQKLFETVPNITPRESTLGGFSNGAHATAELLKAPDGFILQHFTNFYFVEGGIQPLSGKTLQNPNLRRARFLMMLGDQGPINQYRDLAAPILAPARQAGMNILLIRMKGYNHEFPADYWKVLGAWVRRESLPEIPPKPAPLPAAGSDAAPPAPK